MRPTPRLATALLLLLGLVASAAAQIRIGQTAGFTGPSAATVKEVTDGARLYLDAVNAHGGVAGQRVELLSLDDRFEPAQAAENAQKLIDQGVIALFLTRGTPHSLAIVPLLDKARVPLVAPSTGAMALHQPVLPWVFNVRATYQREAERAVRHLLTLGMQRIAIIQVDDSFGEDAVAGALRGFGEVLKPVLHERYDRTQPALTPIATRIAAADAQAVLFIGSGTAVVDGLKALRAAGSAAQLVTLSNNASAGFVQSLGPLAHGVVISQVLPSERSLASPLVREAQALARERGAEAPAITPASLEGFASAKLLVEGLRRAAVARKLTGPGLQQALETLAAFDLGGLSLGYSATDHTGLDYADLAIVDAQGRFRR
jgi:ABC-type branched-subunit amino acid transport system substrate-binding protein